MIVSLPLLLLLSACEPPDEFRAYLALDYRIDRPRVLGIRLDPPMVAPGLEVTVDALVLGPGPLEPPILEVCGVVPGVDTLVRDLDCFRNEDLVTRIGEGVPHRWTLPDVPSHPRDRTRTEVPLRVRAGSAMGHLPLDFRMMPLGSSEEVPPSFAAIPRTLRALSPVAAGAEVELELRVDGLVARQDLRWFVDAGELLGTGLTAIIERDGQTRVTRNVLRIPEDHRGPLRVVTVIRPEDPSPSPRWDLAWDMLTLEVP